MGVDGPWHEVVAADGSRLAAAAGPRFPVNTAHHQAVAELGRGQVAVARSDDGVLEPLELTWSQVEGPGPASFDAPSEASTGVAFPAPGRYVLRLTADDGVGFGRDDVEVVVPQWPGACAVSASPRSRVPSLLVLVALAAVLRRRR